AQLLQRLCDQHANSGFIFSNKNRCHSLCLAGPTHRLLAFGLRFRCATKVEIENSALARLARYMDPALVLADDAVSRAQSQTGPFPESLCRKVRFKYPLPGAIIHAESGIADSESDPPSGRAWAILALLVGGVHHAGLNAEQTCPRHGIARICGQVQHHL